MVSPSACRRPTTGCGSGCGLCDVDATPSGVAVRGRGSPPAGPSGGSGAVEPKTDAVPRNPVGPRCVRLLLRHHHPEARTPTALSIAGSDSGGGAGIQADLKAFAHCGVHGMTAITAITAQSTMGVEAVEMVPAEMVLAQVRAVVGDIGVDAVKVGMLGTVEVTLAVARALDELPPGTPVVVDPVMVAESGARLLAPDAQRALVEEILPRATVLTPNLPEAMRARRLGRGGGGRGGAGDGRRGRGARPRGAGAGPADRGAHRRPSRACGRPVRRATTG